MRVGFVGVVFSSNFVLSATDAGEENHGVFSGLGYLLSYRHGVSPFSGGFLFPLSLNII